MAITMLMIASRAINVHAVPTAGIAESAKLASSMATRTCLTRNLTDPSTGLEIRLSRWDTAVSPALSALDWQGQPTHWSAVDLDAEVGAAQLSTARDADASEMAGDSAAASTASSGKLLEVLGDGKVIHGESGHATDLSAVTKGAPLIALYFSAHWCAPCRAFTPKLRSFVEALEAEGMVLPVIFGSSDRNEGAFLRHLSSVPWHAFPFGDERVDLLKQRFGASFIPWLVILDAKGNVVVNEADTQVGEDTQVFRQWLAKANDGNGQAAGGRWLDV
eukprot:CAMPEP_0181211544 /NCGR_PEP_ID=MMETSP1096-20121128/23842_1 /TAXON_ID=156174 ORGANISM="Chrysochromulina ericina, Strain CCMP281" /NCGR_SAMPLE_ID=MMETSP1096 /ASSEMBLY_ACC=CAM_ASM_000453 /LENGTH=275 /DNA_ID=CAMNT_0023302951 /DNA_START=85 /DNA_END=912 /DNA_ORIENTATION=+